MSEPTMEIRNIRTRLVKLAAKIVRERSWDADDPNDERFRLWSIEAREIYDSLAPFERVESEIK